MKRILLIATGGTIASLPTADGLQPGLTVENLLTLVPELEALCRVEPLQLFNLDSTNMCHTHWLKIAETVQTHYNDYDGFLITHGTDTMAYAAAALSYLIQNSPKPVVLTGSQRSLSERDSDARRNLIDAIRYAADDGACGVHIVFDGKVIAGTRAVKTRTKSYNAFSSINFPEIAVIRSDRIFYYIREPQNGLVTFYTKLDPAVAVIKLVPGMDDGMFDYISDHCHGVIIESFGVGGIPVYESDAFADKIGRLAQKGVRVVVTTQVHYEGSDMSVYQVGYHIKRKYELIEAYDMTTEAILAKMMWALAHTASEAAFKQTFLTPVSHDLLS